MSIDEYHFSVTGELDVAAPATWGQLGMDRAITRASQMPGYFNLGDLIELDLRHSPHDVIRAVNAVAAAYDILRSHFVGSGRSLQQVVKPVVPATLQHTRVNRGTSGPAEPVDFVEQLRMKPFEQTSGPQWRMQLIDDVEREAQYLSIVFDHMMTDHVGYLTFRDLLLNVLSGAPVRPPEWTALDESAFEHSEEGNALSRTALDRIRRILDDAPDYPRRFANDGETVYHVASLCSPRLPTVVARLARRLRVSESAVILTGYTEALLNYLQLDKVLIQLLAGNRQDRPRRYLIANLAWDALAAFRRAESFELQARECFARSMEAYLHGLYNPLDAYDLVSSACLSSQLATGVHYNDARMRPTGADATKGEPISQRSLVIGESLDYVDASIYLSVRDIDMLGNYSIDLVCDERVIARSEVSSFLEIIEANILGAMGVR